MPATRDKQNDQSCEHQLPWSATAARLGFQVAGEFRDDLAAGEDQDPVGDARELAHVIVRDIRNADPDVDVIVGGGEATSTVRGDGKGGRNTETALVAATVLGDLPWEIASLASDGDDGNSGAAGAIVDASTVGDRAAATRELENSDSAGYLAERNALVETGPTGTNANDVYIAVRTGAIEGVTK